MEGGEMGARVIGIEADVAAGILDLIPVCFERNFCIQHEIAYIAAKPEQDQVSSFPCDPPVSIHWVPRRRNRGDPQ